MQSSKKKKNFLHILHNLISSHFLKIILEKRNLFVFKCVEKSLEIFSIDSKFKNQLINKTQRYFVYFLKIFLFVFIK